MPDSVISTNRKAPLRIAELFAGVGGFRLGFEGRAQEHVDQFAVVFSNQWEPSTNRQHASEVYEYVFGSDGHNPNDIGTVSTEDIPNIDVLVGGFPCQDYSVAKSLPSSMGLFGKKVFHQNAPPWAYGSVGDFAFFQELHGIGTRDIQEVRCLLGCHLGIGGNDGYALTVAQLLEN